MPLNPRLRASKSRLCASLFQGCTPPNFQAVYFQTSKFGGALILVLDSFVFIVLENQKKKKEKKNPISNTKISYRIGALSYWTY